MRPTKRDRIPGWDLWSSIEISTEALRPIYTGLITLRALVDILNDNVNQLSVILENISQRLVKLERQIESLSNELIRNCNLLEAEVRNLESKISRLENSQMPKINEILKYMDTIAFQTKNCLLLTEELGASVRKGIGEITQQVGRQYLLSGDISSRLSKMNNLLSYRISRLETTMAHLSARVAELESLIKSLKSDLE